MFDSKDLFEYVTELFSRSEFCEMEATEYELGLTIGEWAQEKDFGAISKSEKNRRRTANVRKDPARLLIHRSKKAALARAATARKRAVAEAEGRPLRKYTRKDNNQGASK